MLFEDSIVCSEGYFDVFSVNTDRQEQEVTEELKHAVL